MPETARPVRRNRLAHERAILYLVAAQDCLRRLEAELEEDLEALDALPAPPPKDSLPLGPDEMGQLLYDAGGVCWSLDHAIAFLDGFAYGFQPSTLKLAADLKAAGDLAGEEARHFVHLCRWDDLIAEARAEAAAEPEPAPVVVAAPRPRWAWET